MPRRSSGKPWLHEKSGYWFSTIAGKRTYLDKGYKLACRKLRKRLADLKREEQGATKEWLDKPFVDLTVEFLDDIKARKKPAASGLVVLPRSSHSATSRSYSRMLAFVP